MIYNFEHEVTGEKEVVNSTTAGLWTFLFGGFYFLARANFTHAAIYIVVWLVSLLFSLFFFFIPVIAVWLIYPFFAGKIMRDKYMNDDNYVYLKPKPKEDKVKEV